MQPRSKKTPAKTKNGEEEISKINNTNIEVASGSFSGVQNNAESEENSSRLEIIIISSDEQFQEVEIFYGNKKIRKKITKYLPKNLASNFFVGENPALKKIQALNPSMATGATNLSNLRSDPEGSQNSLLKEKFLRALAKVAQMSDEILDAEKNFNYEKFWDGAKKINIDENFISLSEAEKSSLHQEEAFRRSGNLNTADKAILMAFVNHFRPQAQRIDRKIVSLKFAEISDKNAFKKFANEVLEFANNKEKLAVALFPNLDFNKISAEKKNSVVGYLTNIFKENDHSARNHQMRFLAKIVKEIGQTTAK